MFAYASLLMQSSDLLLDTDVTEKNIVSSLFLHDERLYAVSCSRDLLIALGILLESGKVSIL